MSTVVIGNGPTFAMNCCCNFLLHPSLCDLLAARRDYVHFSRCMLNTYQQIRIFHPFYRRRLEVLPEHLGSTSSRSVVATVVRFNPDGNFIIAKRQPTNRALYVLRFSTVKQEFNRLCVFCSEVQNGIDKTARRLPMNQSFVLQAAAAVGEEYF